MSSGTISIIAPILSTITKVERSPATMSREPVVVVVTIDDHSIFGRPRKSPPRSPSENWRGSVVGTNTAPDEAEPA